MSQSSTNLTRSGSETSSSILLKNSASGGPRVITVINVTEKGARGVCHGLLKRGEFSVRGITPNPNGKKSCTLVTEANNCYPGRFELVEGDFQKMNVDEISKMLQGSYGVFLSTNYWRFKGLSAEERAETEYNIGKKVADAAKKASAFFIYAGHEDVEEKFKFTVPSFSGRSRIESYLKDQGLTYASTRYAMDYDQFRDSSVMKIKENPSGSGKYVWTMKIDEHKALPMVNADDGGLLIADMFNDKEKYKGTITNICSELVTPKELVSSFSRVSGVECQICAEEEATQALSLLEPDVVNMMKYYNLLDTSEYDVPIASLKAANPEMLTFDTWMAQSDNETFYLQEPVVDEEIIVMSSSKISTTTTTTTGSTTT